MGKNKHTGLKYGSLSVALLAIVIVIAVLINLMMIKLDIKWDLTPNKIYSLSDTTKDFIKKLNKDVTIYGLFDNGQVPKDGGLYDSVTKLLNEYKSLSSRITVKYVDPEKDPEVMTQLDPQNSLGAQKGDFIVKSGSKSRPISQNDLQNTVQSQTNQMVSENYFTAESRFTSAIKVVTPDKVPVVYFTQGHNETDYTKQFMYIKQYLEYDGFDTKALNLLSSEKVPDDATALYVLSPKKDLTSEEQRKIYDYLNKGGKALFMFDPIVPDQRMPEFDKLLTDYGVTLNYDRIKETDNSRFASGRPNDIIVFPEANDINSLLNKNEFAMLMPGTRSINVLKTSKEGLTVTPLVKTSKTAVGEQIDKEKGSDLIGPLTVAVASEYTNTGSKVVVVGNANFLTDALTNDCQSMYFYRVLKSWLLSSDSDSIYISPKSVDAQKLSLTQQKANITAVIIIVIIPVLIFGLGMFVWMRRRHL